MSATSVQRGTIARNDIGTTLAEPSRSTTSLATMSNSLSRSLSFIPAPTLDTLTLAHILNGETCPPISFPDFAAFVSHKEFTTENLLFVIWFRSYRQRFEALPKETRDAIPIPSARMGDRYTPFKYLDVHVIDGIVGGRDSMDESKVDFHTPLKGDSPRKKRLYKGGEFQPCAWTVDGQSCGCGNPTSHRHGSSQGKRSWFSRRRSSAIPEAEPSGSPYKITPILNPAATHPQLPPAGTIFISAAEQPMRSEAERAFATFLKKGGSRELGISDELRVFARETLARSTAPNCFLPIFDEIYHTVETQSLPHFLSEAKSNINRPKQLYWYIVGLGDFLLGAAIFILLTLFVPERNFGYRLIRLPIIIFTAFGAMQFYSAYRGFCSQTWGRSARQVRPWELDTLDEDEEAGAAGRQMSEVENLPLTALTGLGLRGLHQSSVEGVKGAKRLSADEGDDKVGELNVILPHGVHPLGELAGASPTETAFADTPVDRATEYHFGSSSPFSPSSLEKWPMSHERGISDDSGDDELTEVQLRQLAIRRDTIKVPSSDLAFPIADSLPISPITPHSSAPLFPTSPHAFDSDISPFAIPNPQLRTAPIIPNHITPSASPRVSMDTRAKRQSTSQSVMTQHRIPADLSTLLVKFRRAEPLDPKSYKAGEEDRVRATRIFGPERLIEDPRVKQLMSRIVNEILVVGVAFAVITVVLCFAVPLRLK